MIIGGRPHLFRYFSRIVRPTFTSTPKTGNVSTPKTRLLNLKACALKNKWHYPANGNWLWGIRMQIEIDNDVETRYLICLLCNYHNATKCGIKVHLARKHNELHKHYNTRCPFCPKTYKDLGSRNRHLYKKRQCPYISENSKKHRLARRMETNMPHQ